LENAIGKDIFKAFNYTKFNRVEKLPIIQYEHENQEITAITFEQKCKAFMRVLFQKPPQSETVKWNNYVEKDWEWPEVDKDEIKEAIFSSSTKTAAGPDQKAYNIIENRFVKLYSNLISYGYHPICWREAIGAILKKPNRKASLPKSYRVISLLNCLGKIAEKIVATRLGYLATTTDIVNFDQMGSRRQISAIDAVMSLVHDIQLAKSEGKVTSVLFMDVKGAYDHVSLNQLLKICQDLGLPRSLCNWIECFMSCRQVQLAFDGNKQEKQKVKIGIPQKSPVSPILFLIYIRNIFSDINKINIRSPSYVDDISLNASSNSIEENCLLLEKAAEKMLQLQSQNNIQFDMEKIELIHFHSKRTISSEDFPIQIGNKQIDPKNLTKWLGVWLDSKLNFKEHVEKKIADATRTFYQIARLSNTERGLSFQAMRQLYIACITSIADYGVPIWWNNQKHLLEKYQKLQNQALRKILGAFKTSPSMAMELEAAIPPPKIRFNKICKNYALRIMQMPKNHPIRLRVSSSFPPYNNGLELDWEKYLDWNEKNWQVNSETAIVSSEHETESEAELGQQRHRRKRRKIRKKSKKHVSQLFKITSQISELLPSLKTERVKQKWNAPWFQNLTSLINIQIGELDKEKTAVNHHNKIQKILANNRDNSNILLYSDGSKNEQLNKLGAGVFYTTNFAANQSQSFSWNLGAGMEVFDAELFAIEKAFEIAWNKKQFQTEKIWIFSDSQAAIKRLKNSSLKAGQYYIQSIRKWAKRFQDHGIQMQLEWVPGHMNIRGNELADKAAKKGTKLQRAAIESYISLAFIKRKIKESALTDWNKDWQDSKNKGKHYSQFSCKPRWNQKEKVMKKQIWSTHMQLKMGHGYFKSYLYRFSRWDTEICYFCNTRENPEHLLLHCKRYSQIRNKIKSEKQLNQLSLKILFSTKIGLDFLYEFLKQTKVATRKWLLASE
jgi:ribonuclease HI